MEAGLKKILVAEDNEMNQRLMGVILRKLGHPIEFAGNGQNACEAYMANPSEYMLIIMDIHMPIMDGFEATRRIRQFEAGTGFHVPIIALTANIYSSDIDEFRSIGMDDYLAKPLNVELLIQTLRKLGITG